MSRTRSTWRRSRPSRRAMPCGRRSFARRLADDLVLEIDGRRVRLTPGRARGDLERGRRRAGNACGSTRCSTPRRRTGSSLAFRDESFDGRLGWREIVVRAEEGTQIASSSAPAESVSGGLRSYPVRPPQLAARRPRGPRRVRARLVGGACSVARRLVRPRARSGEVRVAWSRRRTSASASCSSRCSWRCSGARLTRSPRATARPSSPAISSDPGAHRATPSTSA